MGLRVGLSGGEVTAEDGDYFGDPVVEAARLCALCEAGQILAAAVVPMMAGRRNRHACRPVGAMSLRGLPDPVETVEVLWEPLASTEGGMGVPLQTRLTVRPTVGVVGRDMETALLVDAFKRVSNDEGREIVFVSGEAGMGKTTLAAAAARAAHAAGGCVLFGHCEEDLTVPYQLFGESLGHYVNTVDDERLARHARTHGSELARLVPTLASRITDLPPATATDSDTERYLLFTAVVGLLAEASASDPVMLVFDDVQWADSGSMLLLRYLATTELPMRVLILATFRGEEIAASSELRTTLGVLRRHEGVSRLSLEGLNHGAVMTFMETAAGHVLDEDAIELAHAVHLETDGNPFFVSEVLRYLAETGVILRDTCRALEAGARARPPRAARQRARCRRADAWPASGIAPSAPCRSPRSSAGGSTSTCWPAPHGSPRTN